MTPFFPPSGDAQLATKLIMLLMKVPLQARASFARTQLASHYPHLVAAFDGIPAGQRARSLLFVSLTPHARESKIAAAARLSGWHIHSVCTGTSRQHEIGLYTTQTGVADAIQLVLACWLFPGSLVHAFGINGHELILLSWLKPPRLIVDIYDTTAGSLQSSDTNRKLERDLLASADAITHRDLRVKRLLNAQGCTLPPHNLFVHDPLPNNPPPSHPIREEIHVVSTGWIGSGDNCILRTARALSAAGIHLHIYFNPFQVGVNAVTQPYWDLQRESAYFHIESPVFGADYQQALAKYDFGLSVCESSLFGEPLQNLTPDALAGCGSSRLSDYISAGLGIIVSPELRFQHYWARRYATATVPATRELLADPLPILRAALAARRLLAINPITVQGVSARLGQFYERVAARAHGVAPPIKFTVAVA